MKQVILYQPPARSWGMPNLSPFCTKLETYLRMAEIPHEVRKADFRKAPKGKIPFVELDGTLLGDSQLIIERLEAALAAAGKRPLDADLARRDRAIAQVLRRTLEEGTYFVAIYNRWATEDGWAHQKIEFAKLLPRLLLPLVRRSVVKKLKSQGTGRHTFDEAQAFAIADFDALSEFLADKPFILGDTPRTVDATAFAFVEGILAFPLDTKLKASVASHENLVAYRKRIRDRWFADLG